MADQPKPLPFVYQFMAGAVAGVSEILVMKKEVEEWVSTFSEPWLKDSI